ncbi:RNA-binding protein with serine-rich domain 1 [Coemansia sp. S146]|nr:RNA-binding protein with serine-rich domain 1 [Coemansia sp. S146]
MSDNKAPAYDEDKDADMKSRSPSRSRSRSRSRSLSRSPSRSRSFSRSISRSPRRSPRAHDDYVPPPLDGTRRPRSPGPNDRYNNHSPDRDVRGRRPSRGSRSRSRSLSFSRSRSRSYSRSPSHDRSFSRDRGPGYGSRSRSFSRSRSRSRSVDRRRGRERSFSRSPSPARPVDRSGRARGGQSPGPNRPSRSRSFSRSPRRVIEGSTTTDTQAVPRYIVVEGVSGGNVSKAHMLEIFGVYGNVLSVQFNADSPRAPGLARAYLEFGTPEEAQKAKDYMDGGMIGRHKVEVILSTSARPGRYGGRSGGRRSGRSGRRSGKNRNRDRRGGRERMGSGDMRRADDRGRSPSRQGRGSRYGRSPSPYRSRRMSRDRRSPVRSRSPYGRRYGGGGGGGQRFQNRSPSPRYGGYRGTRTTARVSSCGQPLLASRLARPLAVRSLHLTQPTQINPGFDTNNPLYTHIKDNPRVMAAMSNALQLAISKGYVDPANPKPPSFTMMMQIVNDADFRKVMVEIQELMDKEGIKFSPADLSGLMSGGLALDGGKPRDDSNTTESGKDGLFKRIANSIKSRS